MDGRRYYPVSVFNARPNMKNWDPSSRLMRAYAQGYQDQIAGVADPSKMPGSLADLNSEFSAYSIGANDAADGLAVPWLAEVAPEPPPPEPDEGGDVESVATSGDENSLFIPGGDNE